MLQGTWWHKGSVHHPGDAHAQTGVGANVYYAKTKTLILTIQVWYLNAMHKKDIHGSMVSGTSAKGLLEWLHSQDYLHEVQFSHIDSIHPSGNDGI
jgi:hypothetical protein